MPRLIRAALVAGVLAWTSSAAATSSSRPLVIDVTTLSPTPRTVPIQEFMEDVSPLKPGTYTIISLGDPELLERLRWWMPTRSAASCQTLPPTLPEALDSISAAWNQLDLEKAMRLIQSARDTLPCQGEVLRADDLKRLLFLEGAVHLGLEDGQAAATFAELAALYPDAEPEAGFAPEIQQAFLGAAASARQGEDIIVNVAGPVAELRPVLDGIPVDPGASRVLIKSGRHIVQVTGPHGEVRTELFTVFPGVDEDLSSIGELVPDRAAVIGSTLRAQLTTGRVEAPLAFGLSRYAAAEDHSWLMFVVLDSSSDAQMALISIDATARVINGTPPGLVALAPADPDTSSPPPSQGSGTTKPPRRYDPSTVRKRPKAEPTDLHAGVSLGFLYYTGAPFGALEPRFELATGPVSVAGTLLLGIGGGGEAMGLLPGLRLEALKRFYVGRFAPCAGLGFQLVAARTLTAQGEDLLVIESTPELFGGTEVALNDSGLRLTGRVGVAYSPGVLFVGAEGVDAYTHLAIDTALGVAWTW